MLTGKPIFQKIFLSHIGVVLITIASLGLLLSHLISEYLVDAKKNQLIHDGTAIVKLLENKRSATETAEYLKNTGSLMGVKMWITTKDRNIIGDSPGSWRRTHNGGGHHRIQHGSHPMQPSPILPQAVPPPDAQRQMHEDMEEKVFQGELCSWVRKSPRDDDPSIIVAVPFNNNTAALFLYTPIIGVTQTTQSIEQLLFYSIFVAVIVAALASFFISRNIATPIRAVSAAAAQFAGGSYKTRAPITGPAEIAEFSRAFNNMAANIEQTELNRREFFANVTHELKTPIASIQLLSEALLDNMVDSAADRTRYLENITAEANRMNRLISDLLDLERLESGNFQFSFTAVDIELLQAQLTNKLQPLLDRKNLLLRVNYNGQRAPFETDAFRLEQILTNLLTNAIRHSPDNDSIELTYTFAEALTIEVIDHGEGISAENLPHIWERFYRIDKSRSRAEGGTGLGLSITKKLVDGLGGTITVQSIPQQQTCFSLLLPRAKHFG